MTRIVSSDRPVAGIDAAKAALDVFIDLKGVTLHVSNDDPGCADLIKQMRDADVALVVVESTGRYHRRIAAQLLEAGISVAMVNPQRAREFARSLGKLEKSDQIDAQTLAKFGRAVEHRVLQKPLEKQHEIAELVTRRRGLMQIVVAEKNRLADDPCKFAKRQATELRRLAEQQIEDLDREIASLIESNDDWDNNAKLIDSIPGIGANSANQLVAELPELGKIDRGEIAKLVGVAPLRDQSGKSESARRIQGGRAHVRNTLYMMAFNVIQHNHRFKDFAERLKARGKKFKVIVTAAMRKLLTIINQMVKTNTLWNDKLALTNS